MAYEYNKWVDDKGLIRWVETGCKSAAAIEDILDANPHLFGDIRCYVVVWENHLSRIELDYFVSSTEEFDRWIRMYRVLCNNLTAKGCSVYPVIYLGSENAFRSPRPKKNPSERYILKRKGMYLTEITETSAAWSRDIKKAMVFSYDETAALWKDHIGLRAAVPVNAKAKDDAYDAVITFKDGPYCGQYIAERVKGHLKLTCSISSAKHYPTEKAAKAAAKKMESGYAKYGNLVVKIHQNEPLKV